ncbi:MAG: helix-turn-helix transcriptional regulator [Deltaproteobacteria bacterium]|nr:helix-turn-helix transcriptional regulator [Deltaproteobacteria bacterium]
MSERAKKLHTEEVRVRIGRAKPRLFAVPREKALGVAHLLSDFEVKDRETSVPWREAFKDLHDKYTEAGATLQGARLKETLTQAELAEKLGVTQSDISNMEHGRRPIGKNMAKRLAKVLNIDYRVFL